MSKKKPYSVAILAYHPIQYQTPFYRALHKNKRISETVYFLDDIGLKEVYSEEFKSVIKWDIPLLDGYNYVFLRNFTFSKEGVFVKRINPYIALICIRGKYDAVIITGYDTISALLAVFLSSLHGIKILFRTEADLGNPYSQGLKKLLKKIFLGRFLSFCHGVLYSCEKNKEYFKHFGVSENKIFPVLSSVDNEYFQSERQKYVDSNILKDSLSISSESIVLLFVGRLTNRKRPMDILAAFLQLQNQSVCNPVFLVIVGDGPMRRKMELFIERNNFHNVFFAGFKNQSEISQYYAMADILILPSEYDPTPKVINEAMNFALPILVSNCVGTANDLVEHGVNGYVFDVGNIDKIVTYIRELAINRKLRNNMGARSLERVAMWSPEQNVDGVIRALDYCFMAQDGCANA